MISSTFLKDREEPQPNSSEIVTGENTSDDIINSQCVLYKIILFHDVLPQIIK